MVVATFYFKDGSRQVIKMSEVSASYIDSICSAIAKDLGAYRYEHYTAK